jgi:hypothetical protein
MPYPIRSDSPLSPAALSWLAEQARIAPVQEEIIRRKDILERRAHEVLQPSERFFSNLDGDGLGAWVGVESPRPQQLLTELQRLAFPGFEILDPQERGGRHWGHFR